MPKTNLYFVFYHSLELDLICGGGDSDGASYEGAKFWDLPGCCLFFLCVVAVAWVMEQDELMMEMKSRLSGS